MKKILIIAGICLIVGYLIFSIFYFQEKPKEGTCSGFEVEVKTNEDNDPFVESGDIVKFVKEKGLDPEGKQFKDIDTKNIEEAILTNQLVKQASVFVTNDGKIRAIIEERVPVLRVIPNVGDSYYIDSDGNKMPLSKRFTAYLPVATGAIKEDYAKTELYKFALFLYKDKFWNAQIEQIEVLPNKDVKLIPRVGEHQIMLGSVDNYEEKLSKLLTFYQNELNRSGWNKYSMINLKYNKQVVCTKR